MRHRAVSAFFGWLGVYLVGSVSARGRAEAPPDAAPFPKLSKKSLTIKSLRKTIFRGLEREVREK